MQDWPKKQKPDLMKDQIDNYMQERELSEEKHNEQDFEEEDEDYQYSKQKRYTNNSRRVAYQTNDNYQDSAHKGAMDLLTKLNSNKTSNRRPGGPNYARKDIERYEYENDYQNEANIDDLLNRGYKKKDQNQGSKQRKLEHYSGAGINPVTDNSSFEGTSGHASTGQGRSQRSNPKGKRELTSWRE